MSVIKAAVLTVKNLHKQYSRGRPKCLGLKRDKSNTVKVAVVDSSFAVDAGEIFGLLGPNGAGKSTTLNAIIAETRPTSGKVGIGFVECSFVFIVIIDDKCHRNAEDHTSCNRQWRCFRTDHLQGGHTEISCSARYGAALHDILIYSRC